MIEIIFKMYYFRNIYKFTVYSFPDSLLHNTQNTPVMYPSTFHRLDEEDFISGSWPCSLLSFLHNCGFLPTCFYFSALLKIFPLLRLVSSKFETIGGWCKTFHGMEQDRHPVAKMGFPSCILPDFSLHIFISLH